MFAKEVKRFKLEFKDVDGDVNSNYMVTTMLVSQLCCLKILVYKN